MKDLNKLHGPSGNERLHLLVQLTAGVIASGYYDGTPMAATEVAQEVLELLEDAVRAREVPGDNITLHASDDAAKIGETQNIGQPRRILTDDRDGGPVEMPPQIEI